jgi:excisionase family DNA binding protein
MPTSAVKKSFCTTREAASLLGVSVGTVQLWVESGLLDAWKTVGGHRRVVRESIERLLHKPGSASTFPPALTQTGPAQRPLKVLVVEDDLNLLRLYKTHIANWPQPLELQALDNGFEALLSIGRGQPDILVLDLHMPEMDGFGMLRALQSLDAMRLTRVVVVTGLDAADIAARGGLPEGVEVLAKPIPFERLRAIALEVVDTRLPQRELEN